MSLNLSNYTPKETPGEPLPAEKLRIAQRVHKIGIVAVVFLVLGIFVPFLMDIVALIVAKKALKISRENLVPYEYERAAYYAYRISIVAIIAWIVITIKVLT